MEKVIDKFLRYVAVETTSDPESNTQPSTKCQLNLLKILANELNNMGIKASVDEFGYVMGTIPSNIGKKKVPAIGFIAHVDTAPDASGKNIKPQIVNNYEGKTLITTDGTTLLGADDKAGIAEIMYAAEYLMNNPDIKHGEIKIGFTPDEEIGRGVAKFDVKKFGADYAYTLDGGEIGELEYENFNAASAKIHINGRNVHPGYAKNKMKNAMIIGMDLNSILPVNQRPEFTEGYEGFFHIIGFNGTVKEADIQYIIRDHCMEKFEDKKKLMREAVDFINKKYGKGTARLLMKDQYHNMRQMVEPHKQVIDIAVKAMEEAGVKPKIQPIRGGTDGANLSFMGLPCPNLFAGGLNFHGKMEFVPVESMDKAAEVILNIVKLYAK